MTNGRTTQIATATARVAGQPYFELYIHTATTTAIAKFHRHVFPLSATTNVGASKLCGRTLVVEVGRATAQRRSAAFCCQGNCPLSIRRGPIELLFE
jgi:hypothetical protein